MFRSLFYMSPLIRSLSIAGFAITLLSGCSGSDPATTLRTEQSIEQRTASRHMVSAAHPAAVEAGLDMLREARVVVVVREGAQPPAVGPGSGGAERHLVARVDLERHG